MSNEGLETSLQKIPLPHFSLSNWKSRQLEASKGVAADSILKQNILL